jgi:hypothetical protein
MYTNLVDEQRTRAGGIAEGTAGAARRVRRTLSSCHRGRQRGAVGVRHRCGEGPQLRSPVWGRKRRTTEGERSAATAEAVRKATAQNTSSRPRASGRFRICDHCTASSATWRRCRWGRLIRQGPKGRRHSHGTNLGGPRRGQRWRWTSIRLRHSRTAHTSAIGIAYSAERAESKGCRWYPGPMARK